MLIFEKEYCGESLPDVGRDVEEAFDPDFNSLVRQIHCDSSFFMKGTFKVTIEHLEEE